MKAKVDKLEKRVKIQEKDIELVMVKIREAVERNQNLEMQLQLTEVFKTFKNVSARSNRGCDQIVFDATQ